MLSRKRPHMDFKCDNKQIKQWRCHFEHDFHSLTFVVLFGTLFVCFWTYFIRIWSIFTHISTLTTRTKTMLLSGNLSIARGQKWSLCLGWVISRALIGIKWHSPLCSFHCQYIQFASKWQLNAQSSFEFCKFFDIKFATLYLWKLSFPCVQSAYSEIQNTRF